MVAEVRALPFCSPLYVEFSSVFVSSPLTVMKRSKQTVMYHRFISDHRLDAMRLYGISTRAFIYYLPVLFQCVCSHHSPDDASVTASSSPPIATDSTEALEYIGGHFLRKLARLKAVDVSQLFKSLSLPVCPPGATNWTALQDRGGLIHISEKFTQILTRMESVCSSDLATSPPSTNCSLRARLFTVMASDQLLHDMWDVAEVGRGQQELLSALCLMFSDLRCHAYTKMMARDQSVNRSAKRPSDGLRQSLR